MDQEETSRVIYDHMVTAHVEHYGSITIRGRHYLRGLAHELTARMGFHRELLSQADDFDERTASTAAVEQMWNQERRASQEAQTMDGQPPPIRRWREVQLIKSALLPTEKDWR